MFWRAEVLTFLVENLLPVLLGGAGGAGDSVALNSLHCEVVVVTTITEP
jgi:hypothetical protein